MNRLLPLVLLAAAAAVAWVLLRGGGSDAPGERGPVSREGTAEPTREGVATAEGPGRGVRIPAVPPAVAPPPSVAPETPTAPSQEPGPRPPYVPPLPPDRLPKGTLTVRARDLDGQMFDDTVSVRIEPQTGTHWSIPTGLRDPATGSWKFEPLPPGKIRIFVFGEHVVETAKEIDFGPDEVRQETIQAPLGGAVRFRVLPARGEEPVPLVAVTVIHGRIPLKAIYEVRGPTERTSPQSTIRWTGPGEALVYGLPVGEHLLRAEVPETPVAEAKVTVVAGQVVSLDVRLP